MQRHKRKRRGSDGTQGEPREDVEEAEFDLAAPFMEPERGLVDELRLRIVPNYRW
jgi:hypothetical protein